MNNISATDIENEEAGYNYKIISTGAKFSVLPSKFFFMFL
jgi:hypothetical protein